MKTEVLAATGDRGRRPGSTTPATKRALKLLREGEVVALPTETVYGLAADALDPIAVAKIFEAKGRPRFDPLIVHLPENDWLEKVADVPAQDRQLILQLARELWPGPFTMVLPKREMVPDIVTAGLDTVAVRMSADLVFAEIIQALGKPLAAPSANRFGRISPTTAQHVLDELGTRIPLIIDAGPATHGIESTIVAVREGKIDILRRGPVTADELSRFAKIDVVTSAVKIVAPGQLPSHYAPKTPLQLIDDASTFTPKKEQRVALLAWKTSMSGGFPAADLVKRRPGELRSLQFVATHCLSEKQDLREAAANLFRYLRELDALNLDLIVAERVPPQGLGAAINDRLQRAAAK
ncbi:MAG: L-threonylcarbamoyladenylate synthase [Chthoniobacterales bacterium]